MKILLVTSSFPRRPGDWAGVFILSLGRALAARGHAITVLCPHAPGLPLRDEMDGVRIERFRYAWPESLQTLAYGGGMLHNVRANPLRMLLAAPYMLALGMRMRALLRRHDIVNAHFLIPQGVTARLFRVRAVVSLHGSDVNLSLGSLGRRIIRFGLSGAPAVTANSAATAARAAGFVGADRLRVIPMGVDAAAFRPAKKRAEAFGKDAPPRIICVGRLIALKGQRHLIGALPAIREQIPGAAVTLVGDGPDRDSLLRHARRSGVADAVRFIGEAAARADRGSPGRTRYLRIALRYSPERGDRRAGDGPPGGNGGRGPRYRERGGGDTRHHQGRTKRAPGAPAVARTRSPGPW